MVEQLMTTGGGWQDQVNGLLPGFKVGHSVQSSEYRVTFELIPTEDNFNRKFESQSLLVFTGKPRLAKNLLQNVVRNWYNKEERIVKCFEDNYRVAGVCSEAVAKGRHFLYLTGACFSRTCFHRIHVKPWSVCQRILGNQKDLGPWSRTRTSHENDGHAATTLLRNGKQCKLISVIVYVYVSMSRLQIGFPLLISGTLRRWWGWIPFCLDQRGS